MTLLFPGEPPALQRGRCLNRRHAGAGCTRCIDACLVQAIAHARRSAAFLALRRYTPISG